MNNPLEDAAKALNAMLALYGPPASVAAICEYPEDHPISLARRALESITNRFDQIPETVSDRTIAEIITLAEMSFSGRETSLMIADGPAALRRIRIEQAAAVIRADRAGGDVVEAAAEAIWRSGLPESRLSEPWSDLNAGSRDIYRKYARKHVSNLEESRANNAHPAPENDEDERLEGVPDEVIGLRLCKMDGDRLRLYDEVYFDAGNAAVRTALSRASLSGKVGPVGETGESFWADMLTEYGAEETVRLDQGSWNALKNRWMRCSEVRP